MMLWTQEVKNHSIWKRYFKKQDCDFPSFNFPPDLIEEVEN